MASRVTELLAEAVEALGGEARPGQVTMAEAVATAFEKDEHLLVQAGTGTGKSLAYLVPALLHPDRVVVATATLALQHQLMERDLPRLVEALGTDSALDTSFAVMKGRSNYACLHRVREGAPDDDGAVTLDLPVGAMGAKVVELREWAQEQAAEGGTGEKDLAPRHTDREWRQVSVASKDCLTRAKCPFGDDCFAERARDKAAASHIVVTNHAMLAIDAIDGVPMLPSYEDLVVDEAHELAARVTTSATQDLLAAEVERAGRRCARHVEGMEAADLEDAGAGLRAAITVTTPGRLPTLPEAIAEALVIVRDAARALLSALPKSSDGEDAGRAKSLSSVNEVFGISARLLANAEGDVVWLTEGGEHLPPRLSVAPLSVAEDVRDKLLAEKSVVLTSATLKLGGDFGPVARSVGLEDDAAVTAIDVGSPFDYAKQGILYFGADLPQPGRDGLAAETLEAIVELIDAADGRTLGLFSSRRAADQAAEAVRLRLPHLTTLAQGDAQLPELTAQFASDPHTVLFGTLSLWQGIDVPGDTCQLVLIDRIPFPRPDDPLASARTEAAARAGRNGFMEVSATHAALLLAQGSGRLIRTSSDRGVVAVLDPRIVTARYGSFLRASLPPMWSTTDRSIAVEALRRLSSDAASATS